LTDIKDMKYLNELEDNTNECTEDCPEFNVFIEQVVTSEKNFYKITDRSGNTITVDYTDWSYIKQQIAEWTVSGL